jgi:glycosyltransferase involved in cell wall biosynthesis
VFSSSTILVLLYSAILKKPVLFSPRGQLGEWCLKTGSSFKKLWLNLFIKPFAYSINWHVTADQEREELLAVYPGVNVNVIPNGIDLKQFHNISDTKDRSFYNRYSNGVTFKKVIISMGRLHKKKGFDILIEAFDKVRKLYPDAALFIAGEDYGEKQNLSDLIRNTGLNKNVFLTGQINDNDEKLKFFSNADVFALASHNENFGIVYAEALAAGTPIVASKDTPWQIVETNNCGKWVNNNAESFFIAIGELLNSDLAMLRKNGIKLVEERYGWTSIAKQFNIVFNNLTSKVNE